jgi:hypothetical protein
MHGHGNEAEFLYNISGFLGCYYLALAVMNCLMAFYLWRSGKSVVLFRIPVFGFPFSTALIWLTVSMFFTLIAPMAMSGDPWLMSVISFPAAARSAFDKILGPVVYNVGTLVVLTLLFLGRRFFVQPTVAWTGLNLSLLAMGLAMTNPNFAAIVTKPDNVPIVGLVFLLGFFTWLSAYRAVTNDDRAKQGLPPLEKNDDEKVLVWPDLVYTELICMVALTALLLLWGIALQAPLEEPASSVKTPNPSKAPWYFLGLQEMLVYFDPWMAGVVLPSIVIFGLMAIPYMDYNKKGNGYFTIDERPFAYLTFQFGFLVLWVTLIVMGTFMRGPNWNFFGLFEIWDPHKVEVLNNVDLSEYFWIWGVGQARPKAPEGSSEIWKLVYIVYREFPGIILVLLYFLVLPPLAVVSSRPVQRMFLKMGFLRYMVMSNLFLIMMLLPIKMLFRWTANGKYFIAIPEYLLNL